MYALSPKQTSDTTSVVTLRSSDTITFSSPIIRVPGYSASVAHGQCCDQSVQESRVCTIQMDSGQQKAVHSSAERFSRCQQQSNEASMLVHRPTADSPKPNWSCTGGYPDYSEVRHQMWPLMVILTSNFATYWKRKETIKSPLRARLLLKQRRLPLQVSFRYRRITANI